MIYQLTDEERTFYMNVVKRVQEKLPEDITITTDSNEGFKFNNSWWVTAIYQMTGRKVIVFRSYKFTMDEEELVKVIYNDLITNRG